MDTFLVGFLSALVIVLVIALVVGLVYIVKLVKRVKNLESSVEDVYRDISRINDETHHRIDSEITNINRTSDFNVTTINSRINNELVDLEKKTGSMIDSRINKLEEKIKK
jgi:archaellum component FlaC